MSEANTSFNIIIEEQITKLTNIQSGIKLLLERITDSDMLYSLKVKQEEIQNFINKLVNLKDAFNYQINLCSDIKNISGTLNLLIQKFANTNDVLEENENINELSQCVNNATNLQTPNSNSSSYYSPAEVNVYSNSEVLPIKPTSLKFLEIEPLTREEFVILPKYMVGRITLEGINKFVDILNKALHSKYNLMSKPKTTLKGAELQLYRNYKSQETDETRGKYFLAECDIARHQNKKNLDKNSYNLLVILRHAKRLHENRSFHVLRFIID